ncbi:MAG: alpha/beta hydrolase [Cyanobacteria bacterium P01_F01_bin.3]
MPCIQIPGAIQKANVAMEQVVPSEVGPKIEKKSSLWRSQPITLKDVFFGIPIPEVRHLTGLKISSTDQSSLDLELYLPPTPGEYPGIVSIYGGAWQRGAPSANAQFNQYLAAQGYVVWAIAYRHAPAYKFPTQLEDVQSALEFIQTHGSDYETQPDQLALIGRSAGAHLAMLAAYQTSTPAIRGVINFYGPVNLTEGYNNPPNPDPIQSRQVLEAFFGGPPTQFPQAYRDASPITYTDQAQPPTLLIYAGRDHIVQPQYGQQLFEKLQATGTKAALLHIPWADHAFDLIFNGLSSQFSIYYAERFLAGVFQSAS